MEIYTAKVGKSMAKTQLKYLNGLEEVPAGKLKGLDLYIAKDFENAITYYLKDNNELVAFLYMEAWEGWKAMEESVVWTHDNYRGRGLVPALYDRFIKKDKGILVSDDLHTVHAMAMWTRFIKRKRYNIYAIDLKNTRIKSQVWWDDGIQYGPEVQELWTDSSVRGSKTFLRQHDIRLVAHL